MIGRTWNLDAGAVREREFSRFLTDRALAVARDSVGCHSAYAARREEPGQFTLIVFWVSRKAMQLSLDSPPWRELAEECFRFGPELSERTAGAIDVIGLTLSGESAAAGQGDETPPR